jgi:hypothetical protein
MQPPWPPSSRKPPCPPLSRKPLSGYPGSRVFGAFLPLEIPALRFASAGITVLRKVALDL